jgi:hypothetical protein
VFGGDTLANLVRKLPVLFGLCLAVQAHADTLFNFSGTDALNGYHVSGSVTFSTQVDGLGYDLVIVLSNLASTGPATSADLLTGLYFDITPSSGTQGALGLLSATANMGLITSTTTTTTTPSNICAKGVGGTAQSNTCSATVAGGWEAGFWSGGVSSVNSTLTGVTAHYGIGTSGQGGLFSGNTANAGQVNYGIAPSVGLSSSANSGVTGNFPYVSTEATFVLYGLTTNQITISNVFGAYGTAPEEVPGAVLTATPEPASFVGALSGGLLMMAIGWRRRKLGRAGC